MKLRTIVVLVLSVSALALLAGCATTLATEPQAAAPAEAAAVAAPAIVPAMPMTGTMAGMDHTMPMTGTMAGMDHAMPMTGTMAGMDHAMPMGPDHMQAMSQMMLDMEQMTQRMSAMHGTMMGGTMPMTGTMPMMGGTMPMTGTMPMMGGTMPMTGTMPMMGDSMPMAGQNMESSQMMGHMMIMMGQMMQTMGHMQVMMAGGSAGMDHTGMMGPMPMMGGEAGGHGMMGTQPGEQGMCQDGDSCQGMGAGQAVTGSVPATTTVPLESGSTAGTPPTAAASQYPAVTSEAGGVTVAVTPLSLGDPQASSLDFQVALDTHTVELGGDLARLAVLKAAGQDVPASSWQAPAGGGHHVSGLLSFPALDAAGKPMLENAGTVTLVIRNLAGVPLRTFTWTLSGS